LDCLAADPDIEVVGTAADGHIGLAKITHLNPDLVTLDMEMPVMDGLQTLKAIRKSHPKLPVIMFSTLTERGASTTLDALALGANDYVTKPANVGSVGIALQRIREQLVPKIKGLCRRPTEITSWPIPRKPISNSASGGIDVVAIGVSTGGPNALAAMLPGLAASFPVPVVIVQHMPPLFTRMLAERISAVSDFRAREGETGALLRAGELWVAPGGFHMEVERDRGGVKLRVHDGPPENSCRPAVDVLFRSVAKVFGARSLAVVLTGMGQDGLFGCQHIREAGGQVVVQDEASSVVWGMPGAVFQAGLAEKVLPLNELAAEINRRVEAGLPHLRVAPAVTPQAPFAKIS
jgi:two-component system chemotaxis response regulator CheB